MIDKLIHYVWVGKSEMPDKIKGIIKHNSMILGKEWKHKIWTEEDFDIKSTEYTKYWYKKRQWAFVSDYIRIFAVNSEGGFYLDTDVVLSKTLDPLLKYDYVASRTNIAWNTTSCFGATKGHPIARELLAISGAKKMIKQPPRIMSTHIHAYAIRQFISPPPLNEDFAEDNVAILTEDQLQIDLKNGKNIAIHEHHDNWTNKSDLSISKYYYNKVKFYENLSQKKIDREIRIQKRKFKKIKKLITCD